MTKICTQCGVEKENNTDNFYQANKKKPELGLISMCKECSKRKANEYRVTHKEEKNARDKKYARVHRETMNEIAPQSPCFSYGVKERNNRGTHGDSSFMLDGLPSSSEKPLPLGMGYVTNAIL